MEEILALKLDADWVVLSACNTGAGAGAGAEAASGLGRAFFYAGTRALLVTNWSVHSQSARELVTDLFKRQAQDPKLTRGEALRQAMMALVDGPGYADADGKTEFAYAHPLFWAPYTIIGDGGSEIMLKGRGKTIVRICGLRLLLGSIAIIAAGAMPAKAAQVLITAAEAALPPPKGAIATERRGITRGPKVDRPDRHAGQLRSPMRLQLEIRTLWRSEDRSGFRQDDVSPDPERRSHVAGQILSSCRAASTMPEVELPAGEHMVRVDIKDTDGRVGTTSFILKVAP